MPENFRGLTVSLDGSLNGPLSFGLFRDIEERRRLAIAITYLTTIRHTVGEKSLRSRNVMRGMRGLILWPRGSW